MNFGLAFSYVFKDEEWFKKVAITALCSLIPVIGPFIVAGWGLKVTKKVIDGNDELLLPRLEFGPDLGRGFMAALITLIYGLPVGIIGGIAGGFFGLGSGREEVWMIVLYIVGGCIGLLGLLVSVALAFMGVIAVANYVAKGNFKAAFNFKEIFGMLKKSFVSWLLVVLGYILAMAIIAPLGGIVCGIGALLTAVYGTAISSHLLGQGYNQSV